MQTTSSKKQSPNHKNKSYHHGNLRQALLDAALDIIAENGLSALTLRQTASRAGVSHAAPKRHFASVSDLYAAIAEDGYCKLRNYLQERIAKRSDASLSQVLAILGVAYVEFAIANPALFRAMFHSALADRSTPHSVEVAAGKTLDILVSTIEQGQEAGVIRKSYAPDLALCAWSLVHGLAILSVDRQISNRRFSSEDPLKLARELVEQFYLGLRP